jgi:hypothetical protein
MGGCETKLETPGEKLVIENNAPAGWEIISVSSKTGNNAWIGWTLNGGPCKPGEKITWPLDHGTYAILIRAKNTGDDNFYRKEYADVIIPKNGEKIIQFDGTGAGREDP